MNGKKFKADGSGQLLIVVALAIAILISSTTLYVYELSMETSSIGDSLKINFILALQQSTRNTVISSLANVSNGGEKAALTANLNRLSQTLNGLKSPGIYHLTFSLFNDLGYDEGIKLSWGTGGYGVSSAYVNFTLEIQGMSENSEVAYTVNVTTATAIHGYYTQLAGGEKLVNLTCKVYNEGEPALAENISLFYESGGTWMQVDSSNNLSITDYGNGTYVMLFTVNVPSDYVQVSAHIHDLRDILVQANTTCYRA
ncbi:MAG: hypothetical protein QXZ25_01345 [Candidatus Bathyarchaeia archaeon]